MFVSGVQQSDSVIHIFFFHVLFHMISLMILNTVPCAKYNSFLFLLYIVLHIWSSLTPFPFCEHDFVSYVCESISVL